MSATGSKVVFVGNVPYTMTEEQLVEIFKSVGQVVGFRLVFDRDTAKPKGYGFCEFADHEIALSAIRNLDNTEVGGRSLRIDLAECDPFLEGKTTVRGEVLAGGRHFEPHPQRHLCGPSQNNDQERLLVNVPPGISVPGGSTALDSISQTLGTMRPSRLMEVLALTKAFVITHPDQARILLSRHPQLSYALFQALLLNKIVDSAILERMLGSSRAATAHPTPAPVSPPVMQRAVPGSPIYHVTPAQFASHMPPFLSQGHQQTSVPPVAFAIPPPAALSTHHPGSALSVHGTTTPFYLCSQASSPEHLLTVSPPQPVSTPATGQCPNPEATP